MLSRNEIGWLQTVRLVPWHWQQWQNTLLIAVENCNHFPFTLHATCPQTQLCIPLYQHMTMTTEMNCFLRRQMQPWIHPTGPCKWHQLLTAQIPAKLEQKKARNLKYKARDWESCLPSSLVRNAQHCRHWKAEIHQKKPVFGYGSLLLCLVWPYFQTCFFSCPCND